MKATNTLENGRAEFAYQCAEEGTHIKEYKSYVKKIPMLIKTNGMGATMAFLFSKKKPGNVYHVIYYQVTRWFKDDRNPFSFEFYEFSKALCTINSQEYRVITVETLALFTWLRRFAEGLN